MANIKELNKDFKEFIIEAAPIAIMVSVIVLTFAAGVFGSAMSKSLFYSNEKAKYERCQKDIVNILLQSNEDLFNELVNKKTKGAKWIV